MKHHEQEHEQAYEDDFEEQEEQEVELVPGPEHEGERLDKFVTMQLASYDLSRSLVQQWIRDGNITVNGRSVKANYKLKADDRVHGILVAAKDIQVEPEPIPLDIVYEDQDVIVVNKPRGMVVHPAPGHTGGTLVNALLYHCDDLSGINGELRPGIVHRLDKDTSGLIVAAKNDKAHRHLSAQLKERSVERRYLAIVHGVPRHDQGTVDAPIGRDPIHRKKFTVTDKNSKEAITHFVVKERFKEAALLELALETGRTHQIRVHMKFIGHPLIGDPLYGPSSRRTRFEGQALHAAALAFDHPRSGERMRFAAPLPKDMEQLLQTFRQEG